MDNEINQCPLCGRRGQNVDPAPRMDNPKPVFVRCENPRCILGSQTVRVRYDDWNAQANENEALHARIKELEEIVDTLKEEGGYWLNGYKQGVAKNERKYKILNDAFDETVEKAKEINNDK